MSIIPMQHRFSCMFDGCEASFLSLREFKKHITEDHKDDDDETEQDEEEEIESPQTPSSNVGDTNGDTNDESTCDSEEEIESGDIEDVADKTKQMLDEKEKSALNALLMLSEKKPAKLQRSKSIGNTPNIKLSSVRLESSIDNIPVIPLLSPKSPKSKRKYPTSPPVVLKTNESSAKFYIHSPKISNLTTKPLNSSQKPNQYKSDTKILGRKRKLSEMDADGLAHLVLKLQDKITQMDQSMKTTQKQLVIVRNLYRKKARLKKN